MVVESRDASLANLAVLGAIGLFHPAKLAESFLGRPRVQREVERGVYMRFRQLDGNDLAVAFEQGRGDSVFLDPSLEPGVHAF